MQNLYLPADNLRPKSDDAKGIGGLKGQSLYLRHSQKLWINNEHALDDALDIMCSGGRLTLWALGTVNKNALGHHLTHLMTMTWLMGSYGSVRVLIN